MDLATLCTKAQALAKRLEQRSFQCTDRVEGRKFLCLSRRLFILSHRTLAVSHSATCLAKMDGGYTKLAAEAKEMLES